MEQHQVTEVTMMTLPSSTKWGIWANEDISSGGGDASAEKSALEGGAASAKDEVVTVYATEEQVLSVFSNRLVSSILNIKPNIQMIPLKQA